jgi:hypothetical protein
MEGLTGSGIAWILITFFLRQLAPGSWLSPSLDCPLSGLDAGAHHTVNIVFRLAPIEQVQGPAASPMETT